MTIQERSILFKIHAAVVKIATPPLTTLTPLTGQVVTPVVLQPPVNPLPLTPPAQEKR